MYTTPLHMENAVSRSQIQPLHYVGHSLMQMPDAITGEFSAGKGGVKSATAGPNNVCTMFS